MNSLLLAGGVIVGGIAGWWLWNRTPSVIPAIPLNIPSPSAEDFCAMARLCQDSYNATIWSKSKTVEVKVNPTTTLLFEVKKILTVGECPPAYVLEEAESHTCVIVVRGSWSLSDVKTDFKFSPKTYTEFGGQNIHRGFADATLEIWKELKPIMEQLGPGKSIWLTGHSLGGAIAVLLAILLEGIERNAKFIVTFGQPMLGTNRDGIDMWNRRLPLFRCWREKDMVPTIPPSCWHFGRLLHLSKDGAVLKKVLKSPTVQLGLSHHQMDLYMKDVLRHCSLDWKAFPFELVRSELSGEY